MIQKHKRNSKALKYLKAMWFHAQAFFLWSIETFERRSIWYSIVLHIALILSLILLSFVMSSKRSLTLNIPVNNQFNKDTKVVHATTISAKTLEKQTKDYQPKEQEVIKEKAILTTADQAKIKEIEKRLELAQKKEQQRLKEQALEKEKQQENKEKQEREQKIQEEKHQKQIEEDKVKRQAAALKALQQSALNDLNAQSEQAYAQSATEKAIQDYAAAYKKRIESVWIMDACLKVETKKLPTVAIVPGKIPMMVVSSGDEQCDHSLLMAFKNAQAPSMPDDIGARKLINEGIDFKFGDQS